MKDGRLHSTCTHAVIVQTFVGRLDRLRTEGRKREREKAELVKSSRIFGVFAFFLLLLDLCVSLSLAAQCPARAMASRRIREGGEKVEPAVPTGGGSGGGGDAVGLVGLASCALR